MAVKTFSANVNKTVTLSGLVYSITLPELPEGVHIYLNDVELKANSPVELNEDMTMRVEVEEPEATTLAVTYSGAAVATYDEKPVVNTDVVDITPGPHAIHFEGVAVVPDVQINGDNILSMSINGTSYEQGDLPVTFKPVSNITNSIFVNGSGHQIYTVTVSGTSIEGVTVNNESVTLPYTFTVTQNTQIAASGEIYQLDLTSNGGVKITKDGEVLNDGNSSLHQVIDIGKDTYMTLDGTHTLTIEGQDLKSVTVNGVVMPVEELPVTVKSNKMTATVSVNGYEPSEVHIVGEYMKSVTVDGAEVPIEANGSCTFEFETREANHFVTVVGAQPRTYGITWDDHGTTVLEMNGKQMETGNTTQISSDVFVESTPLPVPVHVESDGSVRVEVNGKVYTSNDFTVNVTDTTELDITSGTCKLTVDYGDNSYTMVLPQSIVTITAPHRDGWIFDTWSSDNIGIDGAKSVRCTMNLEGRTNANIVAHYQKCITFDKPNTWN